MIELPRHMYPKIQAVYKQFPTAHFVKNYAMLKLPFKFFNFFGV